MEPIFNEPRLAINRIYTKGGDKGSTSLVGGQRLPKDSLRIDCYGTIDELNSFVGSACYAAQQDERLAKLASILLRVQHELFNLGSVMATMPQDVGQKQPRVTSTDVEQLEREIDEMNDELPSLRSFVLPGGSEANIFLHQCRTVCRRAERLAVTLDRQEGAPEEGIRYLNRLSDAFFVWSRWVNKQLNLPEVLWEPNQSSSAKS